MLLRTERVVHLARGGVLKGKAEGIHVRVRLFRGVGEKAPDDGPGATGFLEVVAEEPELYIRHNEPIQRQGQPEQKLDVGYALLTRCQRKSLI